MSCIDDIINGDRVIIGVRDYNLCTDPESRLYINDLPGMSLKRAADVAPEHWQTGAEFFRQCNIMAARQVFDEFSQELQPYFNWNSIVETRDLKIFKDTYNSTSNTERGIIIKRWRSEAARLFIEEVYLNVRQSGTATVKVIDGQTTTSYSVEVAAGLNTKRIDHKCESEQVKVVFNQADFETFECSYSRATGCSSCGGGGQKDIFVGGWDGTKEVSNCYGVGVKVHVQCFEENILCSLLSKMYFLLWYKGGILALQEQLASSRINHIVTFGKEKAEFLLAEYQAEYKEKYNILIKNSYTFLRNTKGECVKCNNIRYVQATP